MAVHLEEKSSVAEHADVRLAVTGHWWDPIATVYEPETNTSRILPMEGVRGFAVLLVFLFTFMSHSVPMSLRIRGCFTFPNSSERWGIPAWTCSSSLAAI